MKEISIIIPVYNVERFLRQCIESILAQSFHDYEVILVDDGSTDNSGAICDEYADKLGFIRVIHQENKGLSEARNAGLERAVGNYICFVDSDDVIDRLFCEVLLENARQSDCLMAACQMKKFTHDDEIKDGLKKEKYNVKSYSYFEFLKKQMEGAIAVGVCNKLFHKSLFQKKRFSRGRKHEDIIFAADLLDACRGRVVHIDIPLYYYRQRHDSFMLSQQRTKRCHPDRVIAADYLLQCCEKGRFPYMSTALAYAVKYPWSFVDSIYVDCSFKENKEFLRELQKFIIKYAAGIRSAGTIKELEKKRMSLFAKSRFLYGINAYARLARVYLFRILKKNAYSDGHGI